MKGIDFPVISTKIPGVKATFDLTDPADRKKYFQAKAGKEIAKIQKFLVKNTFMANMIGKKNSGKGTYTQIFAEAIGKEKVVHISVGDVVRNVHQNWERIAKGSELDKLKRHYRGYVPFDEAVNRFLGYSQEKLISTEFILTLLKYSIDKHEGKAVFIDGLPREVDQVSYSLYFRDLMGYRDDPDLFVLIDIPESLIDFRIKSRTVCPICQASKNIKTNPTKFVGFDQAKKEFYLMCDNPSCHRAKFVPKKGDSLGVEPLRSRLIKEAEVLDLIFSIHGVPKVLLRNSIPVSQALACFDAYELAPEYNFGLSADGKILRESSPFVFADDQGVLSNTTFPAAITVTLIKQLANALEL